MTQHIFLSFIGTDGSGKSTLANSVSDILSSRNLRVRKVYGRYQPLLTRYLMILGRRLFLKNKDRDSGYDNYLQSKRAVLKNAPLRTSIYINLVLIEYYFELLFKIIIPYHLGYSIVSDRYVYDTVINDVAVDMELSINDVKKLVFRFWSLVPRPHITFLVQIPEEVALKRKNDIPSANYLRIRNELYREIASSEQMFILDGTKDIATLEKFVLDEIDKFSSQSTV